MDAEPDRAHKQLNGSGQKTWWRGVQDAKGNTAENSQAEVCEHQELFIFKKDQGGAWKIARYSFSPTNMPQH